MEEDRTVPIMILSIGCNLLILIIQTSYVANLAAVLISNPIVLTQPGRCELTCHIFDMI